MTQLTVGDDVTWSSQANGNHTQKTGKVVFVHNKGHTTAPWRTAQIHFPHHKHMFQGSAFRPGSVFVEVRIPNSKLKPRLYMPWPSTVQKVANGPA